jgi:hypothetical protein
MNCAICAQGISGKAKAMQRAAAKQRRQSLSKNKLIKYIQII